jgi:hypothetical protein
MTVRRLKAGKMALERVVADDNTIRSHANDAKGRRIEVG